MVTEDDLFDFEWWAHSAIYRSCTTEMYTSILTGVAQLVGCCPAK